MISLSDFSPFVLPFADGCPEFVIQDAVLATIQDFYRRTKEKEVAADPLNIIAGQGVYTLNLDSVHVFEVTSVLYGGNELSPGDPAVFREKIGADWRVQAGSPLFYYTPGLDQIRLVAAPNATIAGGLVASCIVYPSRTATVFDDILLEELRDAIVAGALSRLLMEQDRPWTNYKLGVAYGIAYDTAVAERVSRVNHGRVRSKKRIVPHYF